MVRDSSEIPSEQAEVEPKPPRGTPIGDKMLIGGVKASVKAVELTGKGVLGSVKITKNVLSPPTRLAARNAWGSKTGIALGVGAMAMGVGAGSPQHAKEIVHDVGAGISGKILHDTKDNFGKVTIDNTSNEPASVFEMAFPTNDQLSKEKAFADVAEARVIVNENFSDEIVERVYTEYESKLRKSAEDNQVSFEILMGTLLWESKGDSDAESDADAVGLFQWIPGVAVDEGYEVNEHVDDRKDPDKMITGEGKKFAKDLYNVGSISAALQIHHMGLKGYFDLARLYLEKHHGLVLQDIVVKPTEDTEQAQAVASVQADENLRIIRLNLITKKISPSEVLGDPEIAAKISVREFDKTDKFRALVVASYNYYAERKVALGLK